MYFKYTLYKYFHYDNVLFIIQYSNIISKFHAKSMKIE